MDVKSYHIEFDMIMESEYSEDQKVIFTKMIKEDQREILC